VRKGTDIQLITLPEAKADAPEGSVPVLDLTHLGKFKLVRCSLSTSYRVELTNKLGKGRLDRPFIVKTRFVSRLAEQKIKEAGGVIKLVA
jgi:large subunit ribosomal protein L27Ae